MWHQSNLTQNIIVSLWQNKNCICCRCGVTPGIGVDTQYRYRSWCIRTKQTEERKKPSQDEQLNQAAADMIPVNMFLCRGLLTAAPPYGPAASTLRVLTQPDKLSPLRSLGRPPPDTGFILMLAVAGGPSTPAAPRRFLICNPPPVTHPPTSPAPTNRSLTALMNERRIAAE